MLSILELLEMKKELINGVFVISLIYGINYFVKKLIVFTINDNDITEDVRYDNTEDVRYDNTDGVRYDNTEDVQDEINEEYVDECDLQLNNLDEFHDKTRDELDSKREYLMNLNNKLVDIKKMLQDIKDQLNNKDNNNKDNK